MAETMDDVYSSGGNTFKASDLDGDDWDVVITGYEVKEFENTDAKTGEKYKVRKAVLSFAGHDKKLVCNKTNAGSIAYVYGKNFADWVGKTITMFPATTEVGGETKPCIRVRIKKQKTGTKAKQYDEVNPPPLDDEIPF